MEYMLIKLNQKQIEKLSDISSDIGLVALASVAIPGFLNKFDLIETTSGGVTTLCFWIISLWFRR